MSRVSCHGYIFIFINWANRRPKNSCLGVIRLKVSIYGCLGYCLYFWIQDFGFPKSWIQDSRHAPIRLVICEVTFSLTLPRWPWLNSLTTWLADTSAFMHAFRAVSEDFYFIFYSHRTWSTVDPVGCNQSFSSYFYRHSFCKLFAFGQGIFCIILFVPRICCAYFLYSNFNISKTCALFRGRAALSMPGQNQGELLKASWESHMLLILKS